MLNSIKYILFTLKLLYDNRQIFLFRVLARPIRTVRYLEASRLPDQVRPISLCFKTRLLLNSSVKLTQPIRTWDHASPGIGPFLSNPVMKRKDNKSGHFATLSALSPESIKWPSNTERVTAISVRTSSYGRKGDPVSKRAWYATGKTW